ncbi:MAG: outer membrane beta-barrel protein [Bacteroidetes bacterium]|nr:outer membrane beta-barrel protein [Bacteroidota bacterium]
MYNLGDDKELDRLSREAAGGYAPRGKANWQALSEELDRIMPVTEEKKRRFLFWWLLPLLVAGGAVVYWMNNRQETPQQEKTAVAATLPTTVKGVTDPVQPVITKEPVPANKDLALQNTPPVSFTQQPISSNTVTTVQKEQNSNPFNQASLFNKLDDNKDPIGQDSSSALIQPAKSEKLPAYNSIVIQEKNKDSLILSQHNEQGQPVTTLLKTDSSTEAAHPTAGTNAPIVSVKRSSGKGFSYALVVGVDKSTVKFKYGNHPGMNIGLLAGYHINNRWSVHTGAIYTQKNYKVAGADFTAPKGTWISYYKLEDVTGYCRMWEVPLLARYTMGNTANKSSFLSAGLSSYFMTRENYDYFYYYNGQPVTRNSSLNSSDKHILSIVHLSAGFEKQLSKKWAIQVEPYAKLPLGGVGFGNISLSSFGLNLLLQHRQPAKK